MKENGLVDETACEFEAKRFKEADDIISETSNKIELIRNGMRKQLDMLRSLMRRLCSPELTLRAKIATIFCEQGITVAAVIKAIGAVIAAIVESFEAAAVTSAVTIPATGGGVTPNPPKSPHIFNHLKNALRWLADKAASALPEIIGSIISWIFRVAENVVSWLNQNLWALLVAVGALIIAVVNKYNQKRQQRRTQPKVKKYSTSKRGHRRCKYNQKRQRRRTKLKAK